MQPALVLSIYGCTLISAAHAFSFTGPDSAEKLDLTQPINITWSTDGGSFEEPQAHALELWFLARKGDSRSEKYGWECATNLSLTSGSYEWDPSNIVKAIESSDITISPDKVHTFEARLLDNEGEKLATLESDKYAVEGYDFVTSGGEGTHPGFYTAALALTAAAVVGVVVNGGVL